MHFLIYIFFFFWEWHRDEEVKKEEEEKCTENQNMTIKMISTIQWSVFTIANPMPVCFAERWVRNEYEIK